MKKLILSAIVLSLVSIGCTEKEQDVTNNQNDNQENNQNMESNDKEAIEGVMKSYFNSLSNSSVSEAVAQYSEDGIFMPAEGPTASGTKELTGSYKYVFKTLDFSNMEFTIDETTVDGNWAIVRTSSVGDFKILANDTIIKASTHRELFMMQKVDNVWKIARYMFNTTAAAQH